MMMFLVVLVVSCCRGKKIPQPCGFEGGNTYFFTANTYFFTANTYFFTANTYFFTANTYKKNNDIVSVVFNNLQIITKIM